MLTRPVFPALFLCAVIQALGQPKINVKSPPIVTTGGTFRFTADRPVLWSMAPGSKGSVDGDGVYRAPARFEAKQSLGGCQLLPNNHVFNTRVDTLPLHAKSDLWMSFKDANGRIANQGSVNYLPGTFLVNSISSSLPAQKMFFAYTPQYNGDFRIPPAPELKVESGTYTPPFGTTDRHIIGIERDTCVIQEMYNLYPAGMNTERRCPQCTSQSGVRYSNLDYALPSGGTDAAGMYLTPLSLHHDELLAGRINHALRVTVGRTFVRNTAVWPASAVAGSNTADTPPFGTRLRLKSTFVSQSKNPYTQTLITQLKEYGLIIADIGAPWAVSLADMDLYFDPEMIAAFQEVAKTVPASNLEVVDESGLMIKPGSGETNVDAERVIAQDKRTEKSAAVNVILKAVTVGTDSQFLTFQAGAPPHQLPAWVNGTTNKSVSWKMNTALGTLSSTGVYTPPATVPELQTFAITAGAGADENAQASIAVTILPAGTVRIDSGSSSAYTDAKGGLWSRNCCTPSAKTYFFGRDGWPQAPDIKLYEDVAADWNDIPYTIYTKPGTYRITAKIAEASVTSPGLRTVSLESQGQLIYRDIDLFALAGFRKPVDFDLPATVGPDGKLEFCVRHVKGEVAYIGALQIAPDPGQSRLQLLPAAADPLTPLETRQFHAVSWFLPAGELKWFVAPPLGSIDKDGLYTAPSTPVKEDTPVTVTVRSAAHPNLSADSRVVIKKGVPTVRINCGGGPFTDAGGNAWAGDQNFHGGVSFREDTPISGAAADMQPLYRDSRYSYGTSGFGYDFHVPNGSYKVTLKWAEYRTLEQVRSQHIAYKMKVSINGTAVLNDFDLIAAAGRVQKAYDKTFQTNVSNSELRIEFSGQPGAGYVGSAVNGIEIEPLSLNP